MSEVSPATPALQEFAAALRALYEAAGSPEHRELIRQAAGQRLPIKLAPRSLSDWFGGRHLPSDLDALRFLVAFLQAKATSRNSDYPVREWAWWQHLHQRAQEESKRRRAGRPRARSFAAPAGAVRRLGKPIGQYDALGLEVHRAINVLGSGEHVPELPPYVPRSHDARLREVVDAAGSGISRMAVLVGGSSTGKTRACWEAVQRLPERWWLWHPIDPSRPAAAAAALGEVGPYTVVWLNEAQHYLLTADPALGERVCAGLRALLREPIRGPVLVLATIWPDYWRQLTIRPADGNPDPYAQARELLSGTDIAVPDMFTGNDLDALRAVGAGDPRLRYAAEHAPGGRITQHLAGVPELVQRYRNAPPGAKAIIHVAMDARRLGHPPSIPRTLLEHAAPAYLNDHDWDQAGDDWLDLALAYTAAPCHGVPGPLTRIRSRPSDPSPVHLSPGGQPHYRLADYLEQTGRTERAGIFPPTPFWNAAATLTDPTALVALGKSAQRRGRYHRANQLYRLAADRDDTVALIYMAILRELAGDHASAEDLYRRAGTGRDIRTYRLLAGLRWPGAGQAGAQVFAVDTESDALWFAAMLEEAADLYAITVEAADREVTDVPPSLVKVREQPGRHAGAEEVYRQAADRGDTGALRYLAEARERAGDHAGAGELYRQAADHGDNGALRYLAEARERAGDLAGAEALYRQAVDRGDTLALEFLADLLRRAGDHPRAAQVYRQAADHGDAGALWYLAGMHERAGDHARAHAIAVEAVDRGYTGALELLAKLLERAGDHAGASRARQFGLKDDGSPEGTSD